MNEVWKPIYGVPRGFEISNLGNVRMVFQDRTRPVETTVNDSGFVKVDLGGADRLVHKLVGAAFIGKSPDGCVLIHKDADKRNNRFDNLKWIHYQEWSSVAANRANDQRRYGTANPGLFGAPT